jgi:hypothetical protein
MSNLVNINLFSTNLTSESISSGGVSAEFIETKEVPNGYEPPEETLKLSDFVGLHGDVVYVSPNEYYFSQILSGNVYICENQTDVSQTR